ncbi:MAG: DUF3883 domain-containing protein [Clostridia bacterium]|nr:DUF3883 domain-containing protein [Clostridia bacterium]
MGKVVSLIDFVPYFPYIETSSDNSLQNETYDWVEKQKDLGNKGEKIVELYLKEKHNSTKVTKQKDDSAGYDLDVDIPGVVPYIEVKTTSERKKHFLVSYNEIKVAKEKGSDYQIYFVCLKNKVEGTIYVIENPFVTLGLNKVFETTNSNNIARLKIGSIEVEILNFENFKRIDDEISRAVIKQVMDD